MPITSWLLLLFLGFIYLIVKIDEIKEKQRIENNLVLDSQAIKDDIEQVVEKTEESLGQKLILDTRHMRLPDTNQESNERFILFPIMLAHTSKPDAEEEIYIREVFLTQLENNLDNSSSIKWSNKKEKLEFTYKLGEISRHNNRYYLNLQMKFYI